MSLHLPHKIVGAAVLFALAWSCTLTTELPIPYDPPQSNAGGAGGQNTAGGGGDMEEPCPTGTKRCGADCVLVDQAATGCAGESCEPCALPNASAICIAGACAPSACLVGFEDCDDDFENGCEINTSTAVDHCGGCGKGCHFLNAQGVCVDRACTMGACEAGYSDCDLDDVNGCEVNTAFDPNACDSCTTVCPLSGGTPTCTQGMCGVSDCIAPDADCDYDGVVCETNIETSLAHCGFCGNPCGFTSASASCQSGTCTLTSCDSGKGNCDSNDFNGCETDLLINASHCGVCGKSCISGMCAAGRCKPLVLGDGAVGQLAVDPTTVFFTTVAGVSKVKKTGGAIAVVSNDIGKSNAIVLFDTDVFFATSAPRPDGALFRVPKVGGSAALLVDGLGELRRLATDGEYVYLTNFAEDDTGGVYRVDKSADNIEILAEAQFASGLAVVSTDRFGFTTYNEDDSGTVEVFSFDQGGAMPIAQAERPWGIASDGTSFFWTTSESDRAVERSDLDGNNLERVAGGPTNNQFVAVDSTHVYWTAGTSVYRAVKSGGEPELLYVGGTPQGLALDTAFIYFVNLTTTQVLKLAK